MIKNIILVLIPTIFLLLSCEENWEEHYNNYSQEVDMKLAEHLQQEPRYSDFLNFLHAYQLDSLLYENDSKTLFIPDNEAFQELTLQDTMNYMDFILSYHISPTVFLSNNVYDQESKKLLTKLGKYLKIRNEPDGLFIDSSVIKYSSPLFNDGKYYEVSDVLLPKPNIYEFLLLYNPFLKKYIDSYDTLVLDLNLSEPIGYNKAGQTVYDSVYNEYNLFEEEYFPINQEFRERKATLILFTQEQFDGAVQTMANNMGITPSDIPARWINEVFLSELFEKSVFDGLIEYHQFSPDLLNIKRDTSYIDPAEIDPDSKFECSNGIVYNYLDFEIPEELYLSQRKYEAEDYVYSLGLGRSVWDINRVIVKSSLSTEPIQTQSALASNDTIVTIPFEFNYTGDFSIEFALDNVFPGDYILEWRGSFRPSGNYKVYVNEVDVTSTSPMAPTGIFDLFFFRELMLSVEPGKYFIPDADRNNSIDFKVEGIIKKYGDVNVRIEYQGTGSQSNNGMSIDYLSLTPIQN